MRHVKVAGTNILIQGNIVPFRELPEVISFTHFWDVSDAQLATPTSVQQSGFGVDATPRVAYIPDRGSGNRPMLKDIGYYGAAYSQAGPLPGPHYIASSTRFNGHPAMYMDPLPSGAVGTSKYSMMSPVTTAFGSTDWFNSNSGYSPPYYICMLARCEATPNTPEAAIWDSSRGDIGTGPTVAYGGQVGLGPTVITSACWDNNTPGSTISTGHTCSSQETVLVIIRVASGTNASDIWVYTKDANGFLNAAPQTTGTFTDQSMLEMFFGWVHTSYVAFAGIKTGVLNFNDLFAIINYGTSYIPKAATVGTE